MSGIVFFKTRKLNEIVTYYCETLNCELWLDQGNCKILRHGNLMIGFHEADRVDREALLTFFYDDRPSVDRIYEKIKDTAESAPVMNDKYNIYQFFARDPEDRKLEFQSFNHHIDNFYSGDQLLLTRRSIRKFKPDDIPDDVLNRLFELSRWAPTARNTQGYYFKVIRDRGIIERLAATRGSSTAPIARSPLAVAICGDPALTKRVVQDACIGAYHFILAAWTLGLGTCWIAAMDRDDVKEWLGIPQEHYVATVTPLGYPEQFPVKIPERKDRSWFVR